MTAGAAASAIGTSRIERQHARGPRQPHDNIFGDIDRIIWNNLALFLLVRLAGGETIPTLVEAAARPCMGPFSISTRSQTTSSDIISAGLVIADVGPKHPRHPKSHR
jgi:hypothetical protein